MVERNDWNTLPVDKGWAWAIAGAGFINNWLLTLSLQSMSLLFVELIQLFEATFTAVSLVFLTATLTFGISSVIVTNFFLPKFSERKCVVVGGFLLSLMTLCSAFAPRLEFFIAFIAVKGIIYGLIFVPSLALIPQYFKRYRSRAGMIPFCGASLANIAGPFLISAARKEFGVRGVYILVSGLELHYCVSGLLLRPVNSYRFRPEDAPKSPLPRSSNTNSHDIHGQEAAKESSTRLLDTTSPEIDSEAKVTDPETVTDIGDGSTIVALGNVDDFTIVEASTNTDDITTLTDDTTTLTGDITTLTDDITTLTDDKELRDALLNKGQIIKVLQTTPVANVNDLGDGIQHTKTRETVNPVAGNDRTPDTKAEGATTHVQRVNTQTDTDKSLTRWQTYFYSSGLQLWSLRWIMLCMVPGSVVSYLVSYIPTISKFKGCSFDQAGWLATIMGCCDLVGRMSFGCIVDAKLLSASRLFVVSQICLGFASHLMRFATSFSSLIPFVILIGMVMNCRGALISLLCTEVVGAKNMGRAFSLLLLLFNIANSLYNPLLGAIVEAMGSFVVVLHIIGSCSFLSAGLMACLPLVMRSDRKHGRRQ